MISSVAVQDLVQKISEFRVSNIALEGNVLKISITIDKKLNVNTVENVIKSRFPEYEVKILFFFEEVESAYFKKIIGVGSGKGGVGKSMTALNLAFALKETGSTVGILDADIYSPSIAGVLGLKMAPDSDGHFINPIKSHGLQVLSMGLLLEEGQSQLWYDHIVASIFSQFLLQSNWQCDYLIIDFAGGMNAAYNACVSLCPNIELIMVSQPNQMVYRDAIRLFSLLKGLNLKIIGFVENMTDTLYKEESLQKIVNLKYIRRLMPIPFFLQYQKYIEETYPQNYQLEPEIREVFDKLIKKII